MSALSKYEHQLTNSPGRGGGLHQHIMSIACLGVIADVPQDVILRDLYSLDGVRKREPEDAVKKALRDAKRDYVFQPPKPHNRFAPKIKNALDDFIDGVSLEMFDLMDKSPISLNGDPDDDGILTLEALYSDDDFLFIGDIFDRGVLSVKDWKQKKITRAPHIIPNPLTGDVGLTDTGKISYRCENTVKDLRFAVCEMDEVPLDKQIAFWSKCIDLKVPVSAVIHSGSKSLHGWIKVDCGTDNQKWETDVKGWLFGEFGKNYGLDPACSNKARLSRLPGHHREGKQQQRLIYLNGGA